MFFLIFRHGKIQTQLKSISASVMASMNFFVYCLCFIVAIYLITSEITTPTLVFR